MKGGFVAKFAVAAGRRFISIQPKQNKLIKKIMTN
jgi:hypothetical protein